MYSFGRVDRHARVKRFPSFESSYGFSRIEVNAPISAATVPKPDRGILDPALPP
jgi:hypothetical protein